jgi:hypothetical protein
MPLRNAQGERPTIAELMPSEMLDVLRSRECYCGGAKKVMSAFCKRDFYALPYAKREGCFKRFGVGYEEAYRGCLEWLAENAKQIGFDITKPRIPDGTEAFDG